MTYDPITQQSNYFVKSIKDKFLGTAIKPNNKLVQPVSDRFKRASDDSMSVALEKIGGSVLFNPRLNPPPSFKDNQISMLSQIKASKSKGLSPVQYRNQLTAERKGVAARHMQTPAAQ